MSARTQVSSGSPFEQAIGFSRAVRVGSVICVSGTAPLGPDGQLVGRDDPAVQAARCFAIIENALRDAGATLADVIRTRIYLTRIEDWNVVAPVHGALFGAIRPACTVVQVTRFIDPAWLVEVEADAVVADSR